MNGPKASIAAISAVALRAIESDNCMFDCPEHIRTSPTTTSVMKRDGKDTALKVMLCGVIVAGIDGSVARHMPEESDMQM